MERNFVVFVILHQQKRYKYCFRIKVPYDPCILDKRAKEGVVFLDLVQLAAAICKCVKCVILELRFFKKAGNTSTDPDAAVNEENSDQNAKEEAQMKKFQKEEKRDKDQEIIQKEEISDNYEDPALWGRLSENKIMEIIMKVCNIEVDIEKLDFSASKVVHKSQNSGGFNDWKHPEKIADHENSSLHKENTRIFVNRSTVKSQYFKNYSIITLEQNTNYWRNILERIVEVIRFLCSRGLAFSGSNQIIGNKHNGNYLGCIELLAKFNPILQQHLFNYANKGTGNVSYLSTKICDEFVKILGNNVRTAIINELKDAKYYSIIVDSTPDIAHIDQLTVVIGYVNKNGSAVEKFLKFLENTGHKSEQMEECILNLLSELNIRLEDCREQSYDNASNMSGIHSGLQARIKSKNNLAIYVPCAAHSLNLIGESAAECCFEATKLFMFLQNLYNFFAASTSRWEILNKQLQEKHKVPKTLSGTRWSARADSVKAVVSGYGDFKNALKNIHEDNLQKPTTKLEAQGLLHEFASLETGIMIVFWSDILEMMNKTNKSLQNVDISIETIVKLYIAVEEMLKSKRSSEAFNFYKSEEVKFSECNQYKRLRRRKRQYDESMSEEIEFDPDTAFRINTYYVIIDKLLAEIQKRKLAYDEIFLKFGFLVNLENLDEATIKKSAAVLYESYMDDLEANFVEECIHFKHIHLIDEIYLWPSLF
ncbi:unnamed protein product [Psylliodes chrysocephalus]|uniref:DUF4371 domain-containing protein n=1 Tax=Psylliodes chrysocephalus TaxID=3402493 RepID=A0A9P0G958_9CUCU|nr:unnamed protein product [Psylliodes chrysocephala]